MWLYTVLTTAPRLAWPAIRLGVTGRENLPGAAP